MQTTFMKEGLFMNDIDITLTKEQECDCWDDDLIPIKHFDVVAISTRIVYNRAGVHDPNGLMYVLKHPFIRGIKYLIV